MPLYSFICPNNHKKDKVTRVDERDKTFKCPDCGKEMKRTIAQTSDPVFKGGGFTPKFYR